jgi:hypothetical protein
MKKPLKNELIQVRCQRWMKDYVEKKGELTDGGAAWIRALILEKYQLDEQKYPDIQAPAPMVAEKQPPENEEKRK